ncbi:hypothetical protein IP91_03336 [Pseudoduganella lurida]|uniref:Uncharacterized protein n=1 Tax=Pseudoduganella lurida TaxID=1036180 RepID=A0A562R648_9BURK|nr:hypothetical protein [Pseudoduganella lurida]TWI64562.1 hypothetical protein IP91_03336 [Pseudoduganella lurida]
MPLQTIRSAVARDAAAHLAMTLTLARCRAAEDAFVAPSSRAIRLRGQWLAATSQGLSEWLLEGGMAGEEASNLRAAHVKTAALGRRFLVSTGDVSEES